LIREFAASVEKLYIVEELDPFIEEQVAAMGIEAIGKAIIPICGELTPGILRRAFNQPETVTSLVEKLPGRPPTMCPGCPHRGIFYALNQLKAYVTGDIGCYTLGFLPPLSAMDTCVCMGASIGTATGITKVLAPDEQKKIVAVIGDSTFLHSGITGLLDMVYNNAPATVVILDNRITAMTGRQENPASGFTLMGQESFQIDLPQLVKVLGVKNIRVVDPYNLAESKQALQEEMERPEPSVVITQRPCVLIKREGVYERGEAVEVDVELCTGCKACLKLGCPAIIWQAGEAKKGKVYIDAQLCTGCNVCEQVCKFSAIGVKK
jgi:indolepyruvate ferredoxin oxidoreductase alpha subunit